jgi:hypothetical protein
MSIRMKKAASAQPPPEPEKVLSVSSESGGEGVWHSDSESDT